MFSVCRVETKFFAKIMGRSRGTYLQHCDLGGLVQYATSVLYSTWCCVLLCHVIFREYFRFNPRNVVLLMCLSNRLRNLNIKRTQQFEQCKLEDGSVTV